MQYQFQLLVWYSNNETCITEADWFVASIFNTYNMVLYHHLSINKTFTKEEKRKEKSVVVACVCVACAFFSLRWSTCSYEGKELKNLKGECRKSTFKNQKIQLIVIKNL